MYNYPANMPPRPYAATMAKLADEIRAFVASEKQEWQQIIALAATTASDHGIYAARHNLWLAKPQEANGSLFINADGIIVTHNKAPATDQQVLSLAVHPGYLCAASALSKVYSLPKRQPQKA